MRRFIPLALFVALAAVLGVGLTLKPREVPSPFIGKPAPPFTLPRLGEPSRQLSADELKGQVWVLNIWASWCAPCREEHPLLVAMGQAAQVPIYGINYKDDPRNAQEWLLKLGDPYAASVVDADGRASIDYGVYGVPETFVIDKTGIVRFKHIGPLTTEVWQRDVLPLVKRLQG
ncbi:MAG: DsbE family thiol:disulfide interchange protein [Burkholderiaceae bacterium]|nr:DsbE family thiol:disulfide interchange protein [Burkholderiaceae bacterium]